MNLEVFAMDLLWRHAMSSELGAKKVVVDSPDRPSFTSLMWREVLPVYDMAATCPGKNQIVSEVDS